MIFFRFYYFSKVGVMAYRKDQTDPVRKKMHDSHKRNIQIMNWIVAFTVAINIIALIVIFVIVLCNHEHKRDKLVEEDALAFRVFTATCFGLIAAAFALVGVLLMYRLYVYFPEFYHENKCLLYTATIGLSFPLLGRSVYDFLYLDDKVSCFFMKHELASNVSVWLTLDCLPISFQLSSMIFGYIRYQADKKRRRVLNSDGR